MRVRVRVRAVPSHKTHTAYIAFFIFIFHKYSISYILDIFVLIFAIQNTV